MQGPGSDWPGWGCTEDPSGSIDLSVLLTPVLTHAHETTGKEEREMLKSSAVYESPRGHKQACRKIRRSGLFPRVLVTKSFRSSALPQVLTARTGPESQAPCS